MNYRWLFNNNWVSLLINYKYEGTYRYGSERILDLGIESIEILETQFESASAAKSLQSYPTLRDPIDSRPPGSPVPGILQGRTLEWVAISFSSAWKWKVKVKLLSHVRLLATPWTAAYQAPPSMRYSRQGYWSGVPLPSLYYYLLTIKEKAGVPQL